MPNRTNNHARLWASIVLCLGLAGCETNDAPGDAGSARRDTGPALDSATLDTSGGGSDAGPAELVIDNSGMAANPFVWSDAPSETVALCGTINANRLALSEEAGSECASGDEPILIAQRSLTAVSLVARSSPAVEIVSTTSPSGSIVNPMRADGVFDSATEDNNRSSGQIVISIAASDSGEGATVTLSCTNHGSGDLPAAFEFRYGAR